MSHAGSSSASPEITSTAESRLLASINRYVPTLDGLRGIAILVVMLFHYMTGSYHWPVLKQVFRLCRMGWLGVDLFFVLSGFLITGILLHTKSRPHYFRNFYVRRTLRIFPLYYVVLLGVFTVGALVSSLHTPTFLALQHRQVYLWTYSVNWVNWFRSDLLFVADWIEANHFWSLAVEEQFYLVWPTVVFLLSSRTLSSLCVVLVGGAWVLRMAGVAFHFVPPIFRADNLALERRTG
jgi:peptidoglycan/LPS O-acetylase OafA/YrhL